MSKFSGSLSSAKPSAQGQPTANEDKLNAQNVLSRGMNRNSSTGSRIQVSEETSPEEILYNRGKDSSPGRSSRDADSSGRVYNIEGVSPQAIFGRKKSGCFWLYTWLFMKRMKDSSQAQFDFS